MTKRISNFFKAALLCASLAMLFLVSNFENNLFEIQNVAPTIKIKKTVESRARMQEGRKEHYFRLLRDPAINDIPPNMRQKELAFSRDLDTKFKKKNAQSALGNITYTEIGPNDVSGRTRGLAIDQRNPDILIAGGVSGGVWKSTDGGISWTMKSISTQTLGVSSIVQDPMNLDTWYYATAEFFPFGSARARGGGGFIFGSGLYKSIDNGETWNQISSTATGNDPFLPDVNDSDVRFNSAFDFISKTVISPVTGTQFFASNAFGIFRSTDGYVNNSLVLGAGNNHIYADVEVTTDGNLSGVVSNGFNGATIVSNPGVYYSTDDGITWEDITPASFPSSHARSVIGVAPSNPDIFYVFTDTGGGASGLTLFRFDTSNFPTSVSSSDRSSGIPDFGEPVGDLNPQGGYNLLCKVHPTNPNAVFLGGTNLYRSTNGFSTIPPKNEEGDTDPIVTDAYWIGGYGSINNISLYDEHHPDQHNLVFDPTNPNRAFSAHDGGISVTENILSGPVEWTTREEGYNVTQFYTVSIHPDANDKRIVGGTQDNGSPFFNFSTTGSSGPSDDISSGDGSYAYLGNNVAVVSSQRGRLVGYKYNGLGEPIDFSFIEPLGSTGQLFIHPFAVNRSNEDIIVYPENGLIWINKQLTTIPRNVENGDGTSVGWSKLTNVNTGPNGHIISTLEFSRESPSNRLYYAGFSNNLKPTLHRFDNINAFDGEINISIPDAEEGAYIHDIAVNPENGDEVLVAISNYEVESVFYSNNAGANWTAVGGNLEGENGPSVRTAIFGKDGSNNTTYFVGTSTGLYATNSLNGSSTVWEKQAESLIGNVVVEFLDYRISDKTLAIGTHGRGLFLGDLNTAVSNEDMSQNTIPSEFSLTQNYPNPFNPTTNISYSLPSSARVTISVYDVNGRKVSTLVSGQQKNAGEHELTFDAGNLASGIYLYRISAISNDGRNSFSDIKKMTLIK